MGFLQAINRKDRLALGLAISLILIIVLLITNLSIKLSISHDQLAVPTYRMAHDIEDEVHTSENGVFTAIRRQFQFGNDAYLKETSVDNFIDLNDAIEELKDKASDLSSKTSHEPMVFPTMGEILEIHSNDNSSNMEKFYLDIRQNEMYPANSPLLEKVMHGMATQKILRSEQKDGGTQFKLTIKYENNVKAMFKPMRFPREQQTMRNQMYFADFERHTAEIASFHLDRILGFRRAMPTTGRTLNITTEIFDICDDDLLQTFYISPEPDNNLCFFGNCLQYCNSLHPICGKPDMLEGSFVGFFPEYEQAARKSWIHPWKRTYDERKKALWELDPNYCSKVRNHYPYNEGRRLLDLMDMALFDFLTGNMDRHNYQTFRIFGDNSFTLNYDNGRGFGKPFYDEMPNLAPLMQCCIIRSSTLKTLLSLHNGPKLSAVMRESMSIDPVAPILWEPHLEALDRRLVIILKEIRNCIQKKSIEEVVIT